MTTTAQLKKWLDEWIKQHPVFKFTKNWNNYCKITFQEDALPIETQIEDLATFVCQKSADKALCILCRKKKPVICGYCKQAEMEAAAEAKEKDMLGGNIMSNANKILCKRCRAESYKQGVEDERKKGRKC